MKPKKKNGHFNIGLTGNIMVVLSKLGKRQSGGGKVQ